jgi:hypothetical protein
MAPEPMRALSVGPTLRLRCSSEAYKALGAAPHPSPRGVGCGPSTWAQDALAQKVLVASPVFRLERVVQAHKGVGYRPSNWAHDHGLGLNHVFKVYYRLGPIKSIFFLKILINFW